MIKKLVSLQNNKKYSTKVQWDYCIGCLSKKSLIENITFRIYNYLASIAGSRIHCMKNFESWLIKMSERLSIVIPKKLKKRIDTLKKHKNIDQSALIRKLLTDKVEEEMIEYALTKYSNGLISLGKAVELAETDYWTFLTLLKERHIPLQIDEEDVVEEIERVKNE